MQSSCSYACAVVQCLCVKKRTIWKCRFPNILLFNNIYIHFAVFSSNTVLICIVCLLSFSLFNCTLSRECISFALHFSPQWKDQKVELCTDFFVENIQCKNVMENNWTLFAARTHGEREWERVRDRDKEHPIIVFIFYDHER